MAYCYRIRSVPLAHCAYYRLAMTTMALLLLLLFYGISPASSYTSALPLLQFHRSNAVSNQRTPPTTTTTTTAAVAMSFRRHFPDIITNNNNNKKKHNHLATVLAIQRGGSSSSSSSTTALQSSLTTAVDAFWKAHPLIAAAIVCATKACLADLVAQKRQQRKETTATTTTTTTTTAPKQKKKPLDIRRTLSFVVYGALYQGMAQELIYNNLYTYMFGSATTARVVVKKVLFDALFHNALVCIPMAYAVKAFVFHYSLATAIRQYIDDIVHHGLLLKYYALWMPVNAMLFTIVPTHWRITVMAVVSFFWMIILSTISSRSRDE